MKKRVYEIYLDIVQDKIKVFEGIHELLELLHEKHIKSAVGSSADRIKVEANLKAAGISMELFTAVISGENVQNTKPAPEVFLKAAQAMEVNPADCIVVEDAINGIKAAKAGGMRCIAITSSFSHEELSAEHPDYICKDIPEIKQRLLLMMDNPGLDA